MMQGRAVSYLAAVLVSIPEISATLPSRKITVTLSAPFRYQHVSISLDDSMLLMPMGACRPFSSRPTRSMPRANAVKSGGGAGAAVAGAGAVPAATAGLVLPGAAAAGFGPPSAFDAPASDWLSFSN